MKNEISVQEIKLDKLTDSWEQMLSALRTNDTVPSPDKFISLFIDTWSFLKNKIKNGMFPCAYITLTNRMAAFASMNEYPKNIMPWEADAYIRFTDGLLEAIYLRNGTEIESGVIDLPCYTFVKFEDAEEKFYKYIKICYKEGGFYEDDEYYDYYGDGDE